MVLVGNTWSGRPLDQDCRVPTQFVRCLSHPLDPWMLIMYFRSFSGPAREARISRDAARFRRKRNKFVQKSHRSKINDLTVRLGEISKSQARTRKRHGTARFCPAAAWHPPPPSPPMQAQLQPLPPSLSKLHHRRYDPPPRNRRRRLQSPAPPHRNSRSAPYSLSRRRLCRHTPLP